MHLIWLGFALATTKYGVLEKYSSKRLQYWSWQRRLYFSCWLCVALISFTNGLRYFIENPTFNFYAQIALGIQYLLIAVVPCGIGAINKSWLIRRIRDSYFIALGVGNIFVAF